MNYEQGCFREMNHKECSYFEDTVQAMLDHLKENPEILEQMSAKIIKIENTVNDICINFVDGETRHLSDGIFVVNIRDGLVSISLYEGRELLKFSMSAIRELKLTRKEQSNGPDSKEG